jgi:rubredoxin
MTEEQPKGEPTAIPTHACPKCGKKYQLKAESCSRCGLVFALWKPENSTSIANLDSIGEDLWKKLQENWNDLAGHEAFLKHCLLTDTLAVAGRLYRERLDDNPRDAISAQMQGQVLSKASLGLAIHKTQPRQVITRSKGFWVMVLTAMALGIAGGLFWRHFR